VKIDPGEARGFVLALDHDQVDIVAFHGTSHEQRFSYMHTCTCVAYQLLRMSLEIGRHHSWHDMYWNREDRVAFRDGRGFTEVLGLAHQAASPAQVQTRPHPAVRSVLSQTTTSD
jgi:hypothetical protein